MSEGILVLDAQGLLVPLAADQVTIGPDTLYVQRFKMGWGADGTYTDLDEKPSTEARQVDANSKLDALIDATAQLVASTADNQAMTSTLLMIMQNLLAAQPRRNKNGQLDITLEQSTQLNGTAWYMNAISSGGQTWPYGSTYSQYRTYDVHHLADIAAARIYSQIAVN